jgi:glycosyltransferase involved in cell wall biosynthesis
MKSIVIPAYNEEDNIKDAVKALLKLGDVEVIISDDGSEDRTRQIAQDLADRHDNVHLTSSINRGKGAALKRGLNLAEGGILGFIDADMSAHPKELLKLFEELEKGADLAIGSRDLPDSILLIAQPFHRRVLGSAYSLLARKLFGIEVRDFQCGCKAFKREVWESIEVNTNGYAFDTELLAKAHAKGFKVKEVPITWRDSEKSRVNSLKDPIIMFIDLLRIRREMGEFR